MEVVADASDPEEGVVAVCDTEQTTQEVSKLRISGCVQ